MAPVLEIQNLNLSMSFGQFHRTTARDIFIGAIQSPWSFFADRKQSRHILKEINLKVYKGDRIALVGMNGSGKTCLCRCIAGVLTPSSGSIKKTAPCRAIIQTESGFMADLTGRENAHLLSHFLYSELSTHEKNKLVDEAIEFSDLGEYADAPMETYSLGMKSRLSLSLTTARPQELLILDEVYNNADEFFQRKAQERVVKQIATAGAVIIVSHNERDFSRICNRAIVLDSGRLAYDGNLDLAMKAYRFLNGKQ